MLIPGGVLSGTLLSWVLIAPAIPLCILLIRRPQFNTLSISLVMLCVVSLLSGAFLLVSPEESAAQNSFHHFALFLDFLFNLLVLQSCTTNKTLQTVVITAGLAFCGYFLSLLFISDHPPFQPVVVNIGYTLLFVLSVLVIFFQFQDISRHLSAAPTFWITAGIFFQFGLLSLLLFLNEGLRAQNIADDNAFGILYTIINIIRFMFFSIGLLLMRRGD